MTRGALEAATWALTLMEVGSHNVIIVLSACSPLREHLEGTQAPNVFCFSRAVIHPVSSSTVLRPGPDGVCRVKNSCCAEFLLQLSLEWADSHGNLATRAREGRRGLPMASRALAEALRCVRARHDRDGCPFGPGPAYL